MMFLLLIHPLVHFLPVMLSHFDVLNLSHFRVKFDFAGDVLLTAHLVEEALQRINDLNLQAVGLCSLLHFLLHHVSYETQTVGVEKVERHEECGSVQLYKLEGAHRGQKAQHAGYCLVTWFSFQDGGLDILQYLNFCDAEDDTEPHRQPHRALLLHGAERRLHESEEHIKGHSEAEPPIELELVVRRVEQ